MGSMQTAQPNVLAVIPARGGSKGIPHKNIRPLCGKPLVAYSIDAALSASNINRVVVSTDDPEIADVARGHGAEVPFLRPEGLSGDRAQILDAVNHLRRRLAEEEGYHPEFIAVLYPTSPFRSRSLVEHLVRVGLEKRCPVITVRRLVQGSGSLFSRDGKGRLKPIRKADPAVPEGKRTYCRSYGVFNGMMPGTALPPYLHVLDDEISFLDIDTEADFALAERVVEKRMFNFNA